VYPIRWSANTPDGSPPDEFIANLQNSTDGNRIKITAGKSETMVVTITGAGE